MGTFDSASGTSSLTDSSSGSQAASIDSDSTNNHLASSSCSINEAHRLAQHHAGKAIDYAIECGRLLLDAKKATEHGHWQQWIADNCEFSYRQAARYMKAARVTLTSHLTSDEKLQLGREIWGKTQHQEDSPWAWAKSQIEGPFNEWDAEYPFMALSKLMRQAGIDGNAFLLFRLSNEAGTSFLRLLPSGLLSHTINKLTPHTQGKATYPCELTGLTPFQSAAFLHSLPLFAQHVGGSFVSEAVYREEHADWRETIAESETALLDHLEYRDGVLEEWEERGKLDEHSLDAAYQSLGSALPSFFWEGARDD